jgi:hypothetical protein
MSDKPGKCHYQDCERTAVWGSEFCYLHPPTGGDAFAKYLFAIAKFVGSTAASAVILHMLKYLPDIGTIFNQMSDLESKLGKEPDDETVFQAIAVIARMERSNPKLFTKVLTDYDDGYVMAMEVAELLSDGDQDTVRENRQETTGVSQRISRS